MEKGKQLESEPEARGRYTPAVHHAWRFLAQTTPKGQLVACYKTRGAAGILLFFVWPVNTYLASRHWAACISCSTILEGWGEKPVVVEMCEVEALWTTAPPAVVDEYDLVWCSDGFATGLALARRDPDFLLPASRVWCCDVRRAIV